MTSRANYLRFYITHSVGRLKLSSSLYCRIVLSCYRINKHYRRKQSHVYVTCLHVQESPAKSLHKNLKCNFISISTTELQSGQYFKIEIDIIGGSFAVCIFFATINDRLQL